MLGLTVIYLPLEGNDQSVEEVSADKELVKRLEGVVAHWTHQIRLALGDQDQSTPHELLCLNDEYDFWIYRCEFYPISRSPVTFNGDSILIKSLTIALYFYCAKSNNFIFHSSNSVCIQKLPIDWKWGRKTWACYLWFHFFPPHLLYHFDGSYFALKWTLKTFAHEFPKMSILRPKLYVLIIYLLKITIPEIL